MIRSKPPCIDHRTLSSINIIRLNNGILFKSQSSPKASKYASGIDFDIEIHPKGMLLSTSMV